MPTPPPYSQAQQAKRDLGARLAELRRTAGLTGRDLARACGWSESKVSRIEHGLTSPSAADLRSWAEHCGVPSQTEDLVAAQQAVEGMFVDWRRMERTGLRRSQETALMRWERTRNFRSYSSWLLPGAVQTEGYVRAVLQATLERRDLPDDIEDAIRVRRERERLLRDPSRRFAMLVEESVMRSVIGGPEVMAGQLGHLLTVSTLPTVSLGIIPLGLPRDLMWPVESFWIFDDRQVNVELISGYLTIRQPREVAMYADTFARLAKLAVHGAEARALITAAIEALD